MSEIPEDFFAEARKLLTFDDEGVALYHGSPEFRNWVDVTAYYLWSARDTTMSAGMLAETLRREHVSEALYDTGFRFPRHP